jgi:glycosyltransferase involved in cell wall biosynthesis
MVFITVILPAYSEEVSIGSALMRRHTDKVIVDDGSSEGQLGLLKTQEL